MTGHALRFSRIAGEFAVCRLSFDAQLPAWAINHPVFSITRTAEELSILCPAASVPGDAKSEGGWTCLKLEGPFPFTLTGVLASFLSPLAAARISIMAISTFDTDYVFVKEDTLQAAISTLQAAGHQLSANNP